MKRTVATLIAGAVLLAGLSAYAQTQPAQPAQPPSTQEGYPKEAYVKNIPLIRVLVCTFGYDLRYLRSDMTIGNIYVPMKWFHGGPSALAEITYGITPDRPYVTISWVDGKFDHLMINAQADQSGPTWGVLTPTPELSAQFDVQEPPRDF